VASVRESSDNQPGLVETCVASLVPFRQAPASTDEDNKGESRVASVPQIEPVMKVLDNGDVRVIQSAATDVMLRQVSPYAASIDDAKTEKPSSTDLQSLQALKYRCPAARLREFSGTHFHIGELTVDADAASSILGQQAKEKKSPKGTSSKKASARNNLQSENFVAGVWALCFDGIKRIFDQSS
jgi:hypothetical protein